MIDTMGHGSIIRESETDVMLHTDVARLRAFMTDLATTGRPVEDVGLDEMRSYGLSRDAIVLVVTGTPDAIRRVVGTPSAFVIKHRPFGPGS